MATKQVTISAGTYMDAGSPTTIRNDGWPRYIGAVATENRSVFRFVMPSNNVGTITKIELFLKAAERGGAAFNCLLYKLRRADWVQAECSWNNYKTSTAWGTAGAKNTSTDIVNTIIDQTATPAVGNWYSLVLLGTGSDNPVTLNWGETFDGLIAGDVVTAGRYCGHNGGAGTEPYVVITYTPNGPENMKTMNGLAKTTAMKSINGLAMASVKSRNGLA